MYEGAVKSASLTGPIDLCTFLNAVSDVEIREIAWTTVACGAASTPEVGLGRPAVAGVSSSGQFVTKGDFSNPSGQTTLQLTADWGVSTPTAPSVFLRRYAPASATTSQGVLPGGIAWTWDPEEFVLRKSEQLTLWLIAGTSTVFTVSIRVWGT